MAAVTDVTIAAGVPTVGTGTVATLSKFEKAASSGGPAASDVALAVTIRDVNANGSATDANSTPVAWSTEAKAQVGSITETAPATDTASSGLNGRLQRIAQRLTSTIALLPTALGANGGLKIEGVASGTVVPVSGAVTQSGTWTVQPGNTANTTAWKVDGSAVTQPVSGTVTANLAPVTTGGLTISSTLIASGTNATSVKASAGQLYGIEITNNSANIAYLKIYNTAGTPTAGSGTPVIRLMVPGNSSGAGIVRSYANGIAFGTGIGFTFTGGIADADTTSVAASAFILNLYYK